MLDQVSANNCIMDTIDGSFRQGGLQVQKGGL